MNRTERLEKDIKRLEDMKAYENLLYEQGCHYIAGTDEVGRGPLAGPVVAVAIILPKNFSILGVDDSKRLSAKKREELFDLIKENCITYGVGVVSHEVIDEINILQAAKLAMKIAYENLDPKPDHLLIDAMTLPQIKCPQTGIIKGDSKSVTIAAASILAKVIRDQMMASYHAEYSCYAFDSNKGYGTQAHYDGIRENGLCPIHRRSFLKGHLGIDKSL